MIRKYGNIYMLWSDLNAIRTQTEHIVTKVFVLQRGTLYQVAAINLSARQPLYYLNDLEGRRIKHTYYKEVGIQEQKLYFWDML